MKKKFNIKNKLYNHLLINGEKAVTEKILIKATKNLQKNSKKNSKYIITTAIYLTAPAFKIFTFTKKRRKKKITKEIPFFLVSKNGQISFAIKLILKTLKKKNFISENLKKELLLGAKNCSEALKIKNKIHNTVVLKKNMLRYYKW